MLYLAVPIARPPSDLHVVVHAHELGEMFLRRRPRIFRVATCAEGCVAPHGAVGRWGGLVSSRGGAILQAVVKHIVKIKPILR